jgi:hypothetical protein
VLIGDAAGSVDPTQGLGTSLLFRDVRELSDLLLSDDDWPAVIREYAERRRRYFAVLRQYDLWRNIIDMDASQAADHLREGNKAAAEADPALGGFALIEARGPDGLVAGANARAAYFGKTLVPTRNVDQSLPLTRGGTHACGRARSAMAPVPGPGKSKRECHHDRSGSGRGQGCPVPDHQQPLLHGRHGRDHRTSRLEANRRASARHLDLSSLATRVSLDWGRMMIRFRRAASAANSGSDSDTGASGVGKGDT